MAGFILPQGSMQRDTYNSTALLLDPYNQLIEEKSLTAPFWGTW